LSVLLVALRKDLLLQWRGRGQIVAIFAFGAAALLLFSFAIGPDSLALRQHAAGFLWLALLLASTLSLAESFERELEEQALEGVLLLPASPRGLYYGKVIANWTQLAVLGAGLVPVMVVLGVSDLEFDVTDGTGTVHVISRGVPPELLPRSDRSRGRRHDDEGRRLQGPTPDGVPRLMPDSGLCGSSTVRLRRRPH
jgi:cytochrome c-type biogenesis CcmB protein